MGSSATAKGCSGERSKRPSPGGGLLARFHHGYELKTALNKPPYRWVVVRDFGMFLSCSKAAFWGNKDVSANVGLRPEADIKNYLIMIKNSHFFPDLPPCAQISNPDVRQDGVLGTGVD
jgi:hypothetical protein